MSGTNDFLARLEDYLDTVEGSTPLPNAVRDAIRAELPATRQLRPLRGPMRILAMATDLPRRLPRSSVYVLAAAAVAIVLIGGAFFVGAFKTTPSPTPTPSAAPTQQSPTSMADSLIAAWNSGDAQKVAGLYVSAPANAPVRFMVDSGAATDSALTPADLSTLVASWHETGAVLTRTGDVLTQGPYEAFPVTWTSNDGFFNGVEGLRLAPGGLVAEDDLIGASRATPNASAAGSGVVKGIYDGMPDIAARLGATSEDLFATNVTNYEFQDGAGGQASDSGRSGLGSVLKNAPNPTPAHVGTVATQGPFAVYAASNPITTGGIEEGFTVLELDATGLIQYSWAIRAQDASSPTPVPSASQTDAAALVDQVIAAWNAGDAQAAASLYTPYPSSPLAQFIVDSGAATDTYAVPADISAAATAWHDQGAVLTRTGNVVTQGPDSAFTVTWTSSDGTFNGVEVLRISAENLVTSQFLIGATSTAAAQETAAPDSLVNLADDELAAENDRDGSAAAALFAATVEMRDFEDGQQLDSTTDSMQGSGRDNLANAITQDTCPCVTTRVGSVRYASPFLVYPAVDTIPNTGVTRDGFTIVEVDQDGLITDIWKIRELNPGSSATPAPSASGG